MEEKESIMDVRREVKYSLSDSYQYQQKEHTNVQLQQSDCSLSRHSSPNQMIARPRHRKNYSHSHSYQSSHSGNGEVIHCANDSIQSSMMKTNGASRYNNGNHTVTFSTNDISLSSSPTNHEQNEDVGHQKSFLPLAHNINLLWDTGKLPSNHKRE